MVRPIVRFASSLMSAFRPNNGQPAPYPSLAVRARNGRFADKPEIAEHKPRLQVVILELVPNSGSIDLLS
jgi:hypothetical protein